MLSVLRSAKGAFGFWGVLKHGRQGILGTFPANISFQ